VQPHGSFSFETEFDIANCNRWLLPIAVLTGILRQRSKPAFVEATANNSGIHRTSTADVESQPK
jgi:hypothetical protein